MKIIKGLAKIYLYFCNQPHAKQNGFKLKEKLKQPYQLISLSCAEISTASNAYMISKPNMFDLYSR